MTKYMCEYNKAQYRKKSKVMPTLNDSKESVCYALFFNAFRDI